MLALLLSSEGTGFPTARLKVVIQPSLDFPSVWGIPASRTVLFQLRGLQTATRRLTLPEKPL